MRLQLEEILLEAEMGVVDFAVLRTLAVQYISKMVSIDQWRTQG